jgi:hypothetical protein
MQFLRGLCNIGASLGGKTPGCPFLPNLLLWCWSVLRQKCVFWCALNVATNAECGGLLKLQLSMISSCLAGRPVIYLPQTGKFRRVLNIASSGQVSISKVRDMCRSRPLFMACRYLWMPAVPASICKCQWMVTNAGIICKSQRCLQVFTITVTVRVPVFLI